MIQLADITKAYQMPAILLADEPTGNLDTTSSREIMKLLSELNDAGCTVVIITPEAEVAGFANRVVQLRDGRIVDDEVQREPTQASG